MNQIPNLQNEEAQLKLRRACKRFYTLATWVMASQLALTLGLPLVGAILTIFCPALRAYVASVSLVVLVLDVLVLDRQHKLLMKRAAKIAEQFDCAVLDLPWDQFIVGDRVETEDVHRAATDFAASHDDAELRGWYPEAVGAAPMHLARIICQRSNLRYDSKLRRSYGTAIVAAVVVVLIALFAAGLARGLSLTAWVLSMVPASSMLAWAVREYYRQRDTADFLEDLMKEAKKLWGQALGGSCDAEGCRQKSREFQNAIYARRATSPLVMPFLYCLQRARLEDEMKEGAAAWLRELDEASVASDPGT